MPIETFTDKYQPSTLTNYSWIQLFSSHYSDAEMVEKIIYQKGSKLMNLNLEQVQAARVEIDKLAKASNCISGKWMLKIKPQDIGI